MFNFHVCSLFLLFCPQLTLFVIASQVSLARNECLFILHVLRSFNIGFSLRRRCFLFVVLQIVVSNSVVIVLCGCRLDICFVGMIAKICSADSKEPKCSTIQQWPCYSVWQQSSLLVSPPPIWGEARTTTSLPCTGLSLAIWEFCSHLWNFVFSFSQIIKSSNRWRIWFLIVLRPLSASYAAPLSSLQFDPLVWTPTHATFTPDWSNMVSSFFHVFTSSSRLRKMFLIVLCTLSASYAALLGITAKEQRMSNLNFDPLVWTFSSASFTPDWSHIGFWHRNHLIMFRSVEHSINDTDGSRILVFDPLAWTWLTFEHHCH